MANKFKRKMKPTWREDNAAILSRCWWLCGGWWCYNHIRTMTRCFTLDQYYTINTFSNIIRTHSFPRTMEFRAEPRNLPFSVKFWYWCEILQKLRNENHFSFSFSKVFSNRFSSVSVSVLKIFSVSISVRVILKSIISVSVSVTGISLVTEHTSLTYFHLLLLSGIKLLTLSSRSKPHRK